MKYIDADKLIAEIERRLRIVEPHKDTFESAAACRQELIWMKDFVTSLQQEPRFPQYDNIIEKIFGAGNLEGWEFRDAEMLVALAKEELLKSIQQEQPEVDLENELEERAVRVSCCDFCHDSDYLERIDWCKEQFRYFYNLGFNSKK